MKVVAFIGIAIITLFYVLGELGIAVYINSLVLLSDGFHNLSDVVSLYIAFWANRVLDFLKLVVMNCRLVNVSQVVKCLTVGLVLKFLVDSPMDVSCFPCAFT